MQSSSQIITTNLLVTPSFIQARCHSCRPTNSVRGRKHNVLRTCSYPRSPGGLSSLPWANACGRIWCFCDFSL